MAFTPITKHSQPAPPQPTYCTNCGTMIGRLETPYLWGEHIVCAACFSRLSVTPSSIKTSIAQEPSIIFMKDAVTVTTDGIRGPDAAIAMSQILSVKSRRPFWPGGIIIDVYDLVERPHSFFFKSKTTASNFIAAIRSINGSVNIDRESTSWFIIWG